MMQKTLSYAFFTALLLFSISCSDNLTESKVKDLIHECQKKNPDNESNDIDIPIAGLRNYSSSLKGLFNVSTVPLVIKSKEINIGDIDFNLRYEYDKNDLENLKKLQQLNQINLTFKRDVYKRYYGKHKRYGVELSPEGKKSLVKEDKDYVIVKLYDFKIDEINEINESKDNTAVAIVTFKRVNKTPFYDVFRKSDKSDSIQTLLFRKTNNKGWKLCY